MPEIQGPRLVSAANIYGKLGDAAGGNKRVVHDSGDNEVFSVDSCGRKFMKAATAPAAPAADYGMMYEASPGDTPNREVGLRYVNEADITVIIASWLV